MAKVILLPALPPPLSACFNNIPKRGRVKSKRYKKWIKECGWALATDPKDKIEGEVRVDYAFLRPNKRRQDVANREKATSDLLVSLGYIEDDSYISDMRLHWVDELPAPVEIRIWSV